MTRFFIEPKKFNNSIVLLDEVAKDIDSCSQSLLEVSQSLKYLILDMA